MSIIVPITSNSLQRAGLSIGLNLAQLYAAILADPDLAPRRQAEVASALRTLAKVMGQPMQTISAQPADLRKALKDMTAAMAGLSEGRWRNVRSLTQVALGRAGLCTVPGRYNRVLSAAWSALIKPVTRQGDRFKLARLGRYCDAAGIAPGEVDDAIMSRFLEDLRTRSLTAEPERTHREAVIAWNKNAVERPGWPQQRLTVPDNRRSYALPWSAYPATLKADIDAWLKRLEGGDLFDGSDFSPLRPASLVTRKKQIHEYISALVLQGEEASALGCLADVVTPARMAKALHFYWERAGKKRSVHGGQVAGVILSIARHWVELAQADLDTLKAMARQITPRATGMTARNKTRLRPLSDQTTLLGLLELPDRIRSEVVRRGTPTRALALQMQTAVAIELLIMVPIRIRNLAGVQMGVHLLRGRDRGLTLVLAEDEVKNGMAHEAPLPPPTVRLIDLYLSQYWPLLSGSDAAWLFPGRDPSKPKCQDALRQQIQECIRRRCGLPFHPHLFRHLAAMVMLDANPAAHGQVQRVLGHKTINTTLQYYSGMETKAAMQRYDDQVLNLRGDASTSLAGRRRRRGGK